MKNLISNAKEIMNYAYAPYSNFKVGCVLELMDGTIIPGVNVENISFGGTICAERNAINAAISQGYNKDDFKTLVVIANTKSFVRPCSICRQTFVEFFSKDFPIVMANKDGDFEIRTVAELVPYSFEDFE